MRTRWLWLLGSFITCAASAAELAVYRLTLQDHLFFPSRLEVPANTKFKLEITNRDDTAEEFDSFDLNREKVIFGRRTAVIFVGPLDSGTYDFIGEYNSSTAVGTIIALEKDDYLRRHAQENSGAD